jgi:hypothetical protein
MACRILNCALAAAKINCGQIYGADWRYDDCTRLKEKSKMPLLAVSQMPLEYVAKLTLL